MNKRVFLSRVRLVLCSLSLLTFGASMTHAIDSNNRYFAYGLGQRRCQDYINFREKKLDALAQKHERYSQEELYEIIDKVVEQWIAGFLTAHNLYVSDTYDVAGNTKIDDLKVRLEGGCRSNPKQYFSEAMIALVQQLNPERVKSEVKK